MSRLTTPSRQQARQDRQHRHARREAAKAYSRLLAEEAKLTAFGQKIRLVLSVITIKRLEAESRLESLRTTATKPCDHQDDDGEVS